MEFNSEKTNYVYIHFQGLTNMGKAFPSQLIVNKYCDKYQSLMIWKKYCDNICGHITPTLNTSE